MNKRKLTKKMVGTAMLAALIFIFQMIANFIPITGVTLNLSLVPIAIGAILYGPWSGLLLGVVNGLSVLPGSAAFIAISPFWTVVTCVVKTGLAGFIAGWLFKLFKGKGLVPGMIICSLIVPVINTFIFSIFAFTVFKEGLGISGNYIAFLIGLVGINFLVEIITTIILSPSITFVIKHVLRKTDIGDDIGDKLYVKNETVNQEE